jgi:hypothetical protein
MKGHIRRRSASTRAMILDLRDPETGKRRRKRHSFARGFGWKRKIEGERK